MASRKSCMCSCSKSDTALLLKGIQHGVLKLAVNEEGSSRVTGCVYCYGSHKDTPLIVAVRHGYIEIVRTLCEEYGAPLEVANSDGKRPLHEVAQNKHVECAEYLLKQGAQVDSLKMADWTPLMLACTKDCLEMVQLLVKQGASLSLQNKDGWTPFHIACREGHGDIIDFLLDTDLLCWKTKSKNGRTPLHTAALHGRMDVLQILSSGRCLLSGNETDSCGVDPLMDAAKANHPKALNFLLGHFKCDPMAKDLLGKCAIHHAAQAGATQSVKVLAETGKVDLNYHGGVMDLTPLHYAAKEGHLDTIECLLAMGAEANAVDKKGRLPLNIAEDARHFHCVELFKHHAAH